MNSVPVQVVSNLKERLARDSSPKPTVENQLDPNDIYPVVVPIEPHPKLAAVWRRSGGEMELMFKGGIAVILLDFAVQGESYLDVDYAMATIMRCLKADPLVRSIVTPPEDGYHETLDLFVQSITLEVNGS